MVVSQDEFVIVEIHDSIQNMLDNTSHPNALSYYDPTKGWVIGYSSCNWDDWDEDEIW